MNPFPATLVTLVGLSTLSVAGSAAAAGGDGTGRTHTHDYRAAATTVLRARPGPSAQIARLRNDTTVRMRCWTDAGGDHTGNYTSRRWFAVSVPGRRAANGWVHSSDVWDQVVVSQCWTGLPTLDPRSWLRP